MIGFHKLNKKRHIRMKLPCLFCREIAPPMPGREACLHRKDSEKVVKKQKKVVKNNKKDT